ncbi:MAG: GSCFA domain-containing protein [Duncaniella freteri]|uniref:GSCFA domain-containing protein n=1 Tax=uncultured Duncaniella sp. TaxID=2768039 RepID=UPI0023D528A6|nr:GSCFA domain-containing protein [uncultured Duncaniella sp.]MDE7027670.1 GSCFA domain-containing protein [Duncaniella freteri]
MIFRTEVSPEKGLEGLLSHGTPVVLVGSCFTDNIGACMRDDLFDVIVNPFGPIYNPSSVRRAVSSIVDGISISPGDLFPHEGRFHSHLFHSRYSGCDREAAALAMTRQIHLAREALLHASSLIVTLGTTRVFRHRQQGMVVANCHRLPSSSFREETLSLDQCTDDLESLVSMVRTVNPDIHIIFTVSPLRYLGQGAHINSISKATLLLAIDSVVRTFPSTHYFPSFEIMMDDLRDYRFYADDMKHPTDQAVRYIYDIFSATYFSPSTRDLASQSRRLTRRLAHRPMGGTPADDTSQIIEEFTKAHPLLAPIIDRYISNGL